MAIEPFRKIERPSRGLKVWQRFRSTKIMRLDTGTLLQQIKQTRLPSHETWNIPIVSFESSLLSRITNKFYIIFLEGRY